MSYTLVTVIVWRDVLAGGIVYNITFGDNINTKLSGSIAVFYFKLQKPQNTKMFLLVSHFPFMPGDKCEHSNSAISFTITLKMNSPNKSKNFLFIFWNMFKSVASNMKKFEYFLSSYTTLKQNT